MKSVSFTTAVRHDQNVLYRSRDSGTCTADSLLCTKPSDAIGRQRKLLFNVVLEYENGEGRKPFLNYRTALVLDTSTSFKQNGSVGFSVDCESF
jgi:hypothetical protein